VLVTGSNGFIGKNLIVRLNELHIQVVNYTRENSTQDLKNLIKGVDCIVHLAGENRPKDKKDFNIVNAGLTKSICDTVRSLGGGVSIILASSIQADFDNAYGRSKLDAETSVKALESDMKLSVYIYRLPGVFGKWCKPNYNSVVATFCYNISHNLPVQINDSLFELRLVYIDDVVKELIEAILGNRRNREVLSVQPEYKVKLGDLADQIKAFKDSRDSMVIEKVGSGFIRKLHSTYLSYLPPEQFLYSIPLYNDKRGVFAEILKTKDSGQFSFFTAKPGVTRGGHYHHSKTEKFLVVQGRAEFKFRHILTDETHKITVTSKNLEIIETVPGWSHNITNIGIEDMVVMLWANEVFNPDEPDTISYTV